MNEENGHIEIEVDLMRIDTDEEGEALRDEDGKIKMKKIDTVKTTFDKCKTPVELGQVNGLLAELIQEQGYYNLMRKEVLKKLEDVNVSVSDRIDAKNDMMKLERSHKESSLPLMNRLHGELKRRQFSGKPVDEYEMQDLAALGTKYWLTHKFTEDERKNLPSGSASS